MERIRRCSDSALYKHAQDKEHTINYEEIVILDKACSDHKLRLKELLHLNKSKPNPNRG